MRRIKFKHTWFTNFILILVLIFVGFVSVSVGETQNTSSGGKVSAIYNGDRSKNRVSLMFNVYEGERIVESILGVLNKYNAKATFFVGGCWADDNQETLIKIVESGNEIANHGYFHKDHKKLSIDKNREEILNTEKIVLGLCGARTKLFAPPSGSFSDLTLQVADECGYKLIMWSKDTIDWRDKSIDKVYTRATKNVSNGDFILMHPKQHTLLALPSILEYYSNMNLSVVTVSDNLNIRGR